MGTKGRLQLCSGRSLLLYVVSASLIIHDSFCCDAPDEITDELSSIMFPKQEYHKKNQKNDFVNPAWFFKLNPGDTQCIPLYSQSRNILAISGMNCTVIPLKLDSIVQIDSLISIRWTGLKKLESYALSTWKNVLALQINENEYLTELDRYAFSGMDNLVELKISDNPKLTTLHESTFENLFFLQQLSLQRNNFITVSDIAKGLNLFQVPMLDSLDISGNPIVSLHQDDFISLLDLGMTKLLMRDIDFKDVGPDPFFYLSSLREISLGSLYPSNLSVELLTHINEYKDLSEIGIHNMDLSGSPNALFETITKESYKKIFIKGCKIGAIPKNTEITVDRLEEIEISESFIKEFPRVFFKPYVYPMVNKIILKFNQFTSIPDDIESSQVKLLDLTGNKLRILKERNFYFAKELQVLILTDTSLENIEERAFQVNKDLIALVMSMNDFHESSLVFNKEIFAGLGNLKALDLSQCNINGFKDVHIFEHLKKIQYLNLKSNNIRKIHPDLFKPMPCLKKLDLRNTNVLNIPSTFFEINNFLTDIGLFSSLYKIDKNLINWLQLVDITEKESKMLTNCTQLKVIERNNLSSVIDVNFTGSDNQKQQVCLITIQNSGSKNKSHMLAKPTNSNGKETDSTTEVIYVDVINNDNNNNDDFPNNNTQSGSGMFEFILVLFRPSNVYKDLQSGNAWSILRFIYVFLFYLIISTLIVVLLVKLVGCCSRWQKKKRHGLIFEEKIDYCGVENKGFNIPYEQMANVKLNLNDEKY